MASPFWYRTIFFAYIAVFLGIYVFRDAWICLLLYHLVLCLSFIQKKHIGIHTKIQRKWLIGLSLICASAGFRMYFGLPFFGIHLHSQEMLAAYGLSATSAVLFVLYFSLINPCIEEFFWRVHGPQQKIAPLADILFAGYHALVLAVFLPWWLVLLSCISLCIMGAIWRRHYRTHCDFITLAISHAVADASIIICAAYFLG